MNRILVIRGGATLLIVGGEADGRQLASLRANFSERVCFAENLDLPRLAAVLQTAGISAKVVNGREATHTTINDNIGAPDDSVTKELFAFVAEALKR